VKPGEEGPDGNRREDLGHSYRAHTGDTGAAFEEHNTSVIVEKRSHTGLWIVLILIVLLAAFLVYHFTGSGSKASSGSAAAGGGRGQNGPAAITVGESKTGDINIYVDALGTVTPTATVTLYSQITGRVIAVYYHEGQVVTKGQALVDIDPRPYQATLTQAEGSLQHDQGVLAQAKIDLARYQAAYAKNAIAKQQLDDQEQAVVQDEGTVKADQGTVEYDKVQLSYCHIVAPISGRVGLRLVDPGNTVFSGSSSTLVVITQLQPITVVFSPSEDNLPSIQAQLKTSKTLEVDAYDRADEKELEVGKLTAYDNQIDTTTGTVKFRASFPNKDIVLFPNQFVNARLLLKTLKNATLIPTVAVQHNGTAAFVYLVNPNSTVAVQAIDVVTNNDTDTAVTGIDPGVKIATSGFDRLENGAKVLVKQPGKKGAAGSSGSTGSGAPGAVSPASSSSSTSPGANGSTTGGSKAS
jgi:multidrug efflux system membrane fusion protein